MVPSDLWRMLACGAFLTVAACKGEKPAPWAATPRDSIVGTHKITFAAVEECKVRSSDVTLQATAGDITLGFDVILEGVGDQAVSLYPKMFTAIDPHGHSYEPYVRDGCYPEVDWSLSVSKGEKHRGWLTLKVPKETKQLRVVFRPQVIAGDEATIQVRR